MICPHCHGDPSGNGEAARTRKNGTRKRGNMRLQQWQCKACGASWQDDSVLTHHTPTLIAQEMRSLYDDEGKTMRAIAAIAHCSYERVRQMLNDTPDFVPRRSGRRKCKSG